MPALEGGAALPVTTGGSGKTEGGAAVPVYVVSGGPVVGQRARRVVVVTSGPVDGGAAMPVYDAGANALYTDEPALAVYVVAGGTLGASAPVNTGLPVISGTTELDATLSATDGTWTGTPTFTYQWNRNGVAIGGATNNTYVLVSADFNMTITVTVTATNAGGSASATSAGTAIWNWLFNDQFTTAQAAPLGSPRTPEPGPGTATIVDTGNKLTINASNRLIAAAATVAHTDPRYTGDLLPRLAGRAIATRQKGATWMAGFCNTGDTTPRSGIQAFSSSFFMMDNNVGTSLVPFTTTVDHEFLYIQLDIGAYMAVKGGTWANWTLLWPCTLNTANNKIGSQKLSWGNNAAAEVDFIEEKDFGGVWSRSYGFASYAAYKPTVPNTVVATADLLCQVTWAAIAGSTDMDLCIRHTDDNNCWIVRLTQSDNTIKLIEKVAGVETARVSTAFTAGAGSTNQVVIRAEAQRITIGVNGATRGSYTSASFNQTATGVKLQSSTSTPFYFNVWPLALPALPSSTGTLPVHIYPYGDSKTVGTGDDAIYGTLGNGYPWMICEATEASRGAGCFERPTRTAAGGRTTASAAAAVVAELAAKDGTPDYILYNLGANDVSAMPVEATWKTNTAAIWDAMHTKWPNAHIYVMRVWVRGQATNCNTLATWQDDVLATRSAWAHPGPDERVFLENGDDGVTYTTDGIHPNHAGYILTAAQWKTALGI